MLKSKIEINIRDRYHAVNTCINTPTASTWYVREIDCGQFLTIVCYKYKYNYIHIVALYIVFH